MTKNYVIGIELGSTRIKAVMIDKTGKALAVGGFDWENSLRDGYWTYSLDEVWTGIRDCYAALAADYKNKFGEDITEVAAIGISAMMHGYLAFDENGELLVPFRTWRNTSTAEAAGELSGLFSFNIPQRWSVAHYYQAVLSGEEHVKSVAFLTTLSGYVHYKLTGKKVLGIGDASGMFPVVGGDFDKEKLALINKQLHAHGIEKDFGALLPDVRLAGEDAGTLSEVGALLLDPSGKLKPGCKLCPPEGDAGTGMVATNSISQSTANVSAGTSAFLMAVLEKNLSEYYSEIDVVATPNGNPVAMVHVNNFTSEINAWTSLLGEAIALGGGTISGGELIDKLFDASRDSTEDCGGLIGYNFLSGEHIVDVESGRPLIVRTPDTKLTLGGFMKMQIYSALGTLAIGMETLHREGVKLTSVCGHGGFFKAGEVAQGAMSAALGAPVTVMKNAGEGGAWGIALLALFTAYGEGRLDDMLDEIFGETPKTTASASKREINDFARFLEAYRSCLPLEKLASELI